MARVRLANTRPPGAYDYASSFSLFLFFSMVAVLAVPLTSQAQILNQDPDPPALPNYDDDHVWAGDLNADGFFDYVHTSTSTNTVYVYIGQANDQFTLAHIIAMSEPTAVTLGDLNADGYDDIVVGSRFDDSVRIAYGDPSLIVAFGSPIIVGFDPGVIAIADICNDGLPELLVSNEQRNTLKLIKDSTTAPAVYTVNSNTAINCPTDASTAGPCNDYTEPDCDESPTNPGIQECQRATSCRFKKCMWAACIELHDGSGAWGPEYVYYCWQVEACAAVAGLDHVKCIPFP